MVKHDGWNHEYVVYEELGRRKKVDLGVALDRMWLIRSGFDLGNHSEKDVVDHLAESGISAEWVDSESDAHAMRSEEETA